MRDPFQPSTSTNLTPSSPPNRPARRGPGPIQTQNLRRPSAGSVNQAYDGFTTPVSALPPDNSGTSNTLFSDPFAADRSQRSQLRAQTSAAVEQSSRPTPSSAASDKLRNVVGAFMSASRSRDELERRPQKNEARQRDKARREHKQDVWEGTTDGKFSEIENVLRKIKKDWPFVLESDFSPSTLALSLLSQAPSSSLPQHPSLNSFLRLHDALSTALQSAVQQHFQTFAASLPAHATFLATLGRAQQQVKLSKEALKEAREGFAGKGKSELAGIRAREQQQTPDQLDGLVGEKKFLKASLILMRSLKTVNRPEIAEIGAMSDLKSYFTSQESTLTDILVEELHNHLYLKNYYSDSRWRAYTPGQYTRELFNVSRPASLTWEVPVLEGPDNDSSRPNSLRQSFQNSSLNDNAVAGPGPSSRFSRYISSLAVKPAHDPTLELDPEYGSNSATLVNGGGANGMAPVSSSHMSLISLAGHQASEQNNPEVDSFTYVETLLEALATLGHLSTALDKVAQRTATEVHALVDATLDEVEERADQRREESEAMARPQSMLMNGNPEVLVAQTEQTTHRKSLFAPAETLRIAVALDAAGPAKHAVILRDLFWTLYSKLAAVLENHRVVYEVSRWISSVSRVSTCFHLLIVQRRDFKDVSAKASTGLNIPVLEVWKPVQQEVRNLLQDYLTDDAQAYDSDRHPIMSINEILRDGKVARDKQRQMFHFGDTDTRAMNNDLKIYDDSVQQALKTSVPGLVNMQTAPDGPANAQHQVLQGSMADADDSYAGSARHRTLIPPNAFNVSTLFQPTLAFIERATEVVPPGFEEETSGFSSVLEDFVVKVFLPQLDEKVTASFQQAVSGYDAYQLDRFVDHGLDKPPLKSSVRVMALIHGLCVMLQTTPFHRENYSRLIIGVIVQYYQQCSARFKELASLPAQGLGEPPLALPAQWAQREDIIACLGDLRNVIPVDLAEVHVVSMKEVKLEMDLLGDGILVESQLISSTRKLEALGTLMQSLRWFIDSLLDLQTEAEDSISPDGNEPLGSAITSSLAPPEQLNPEDEPRLPLTRAMAQRYEAIVQTYEQLAEMVLNTIRLEIRCRVVCNLGASLRTGEFRLESESFEPDPDVVDLNGSLTECDDVVSATLVDADRDFVFRGLGSLVDHMFIHAARSIKMVNLAGVHKMKRDILALQQALRGINHGPEEGILSRAMTYWDLYGRGPKEMLETIRINKPMFTFEDYNTMLNLQCKTDMSEAPSSELNTYLIDLHALSMSIEGWEIGIE
ncbi:hypothetical protein TREMEDRAFT_31499 [Tremella mesenterica DSM 1558]|uniref:uncharacterized protein n=1 Tax=Tremella mesenterica (strain ATCC 24925 / CBS 8224 / DSM 1558 / NBRC 9311 / NRRL Y-6157 / RJB 2259-6 / UBC 559-6) TaxID=578456 RepID=UPI0003F493E6|nr:uncharacterized protein TREMEDRAFT_31499 [Tremella mesenterica DSM 1558]EIW69172.1 hypothetical protein TREMEDRAFT_31499 [Tremella mesenterica DSM 1558]